MSGLKKIISTKKIFYPGDNDLWVEIFEDINMGIAEKMDLSNPKDARNSYVLITGLVDDWNFADKDGTKLPISEDGVRKLPSRIAEWIIQEGNRILMPDNNKKKS